MSILFVWCMAKIELNFILFSTKINLKKNFEPKIEKAT